MSVKIWNIVDKLYHLLGLLLLLLVLVAIALRLTHNTKWNMTKVLKVNFKEEKKRTTTQCDYFSGKWVYDNISYPLYKESQCSFIEDHFACQQSGRPDSKYQYWRWQPHLCDLPRFDGKALLEKLRSKRVVFVGDSLSRNAYQSMLCLIEPHLPPFTNKSVVLTGNLYTFKVKDYNATLEFYWSPFLVESNGDDPINHSVFKERIIRIGGIEKHARVWTDSDILIFNSYAWWMDSKFTLLWGAVGSSNAFYKRVVSKNRLYQIALRTWSDWLKINLNRTRTNLFFMGYSPNHFLSYNWGSMHGNCVDEGEIITHEKVHWSLLENEKGLMEVVESTFHKLETSGVKVNYINITHLTAYRKDAHPSIYSAWSKRLERYKSRKQGSLHADCLHWCLPGVPDVWNQILYTYIMGS